MGLSPATHRFSQTFALLAQRAEASVVHSPPWLRKCVVAILLLGVCLLSAMEMKYSWIESRFFAMEAARVNYKLAPGPNRSIEYPDAGPYDLQLGYSMQPTFLERLRSEGYSIEEQARDSGWSLLLARLGIYPIYHEKNQAGLGYCYQWRNSIYFFRG